MPNSLVGVGAAFQRIEGELHPVAATTFTIAEEVETETAQCSPLEDCGPLVDYDTVTRSRTTNVTLATSSVDDQDAAWLIWGQKWQTAGANSNLAVPRLAFATVPSAAPYEVALTGMTAATIHVEVTIIDSIAPGKVPLMRSADATPDAGEFAPDADKIVLNAAQAGKRIAIYSRETIASRISGVY
jgi:hypothetical protein